MPSADFCLITHRVAPVRAIGFHRFALLSWWGWEAKALIDQSLTGYLTDRWLSRSPQIRTWTFTALLHHLRWPLDHLASLSCANSPPAYASYDVLVHQLAVLRPASSRQGLAALPLPFASSCRLLSWFSEANGDLPTEDFHLISSCPCWAYTRPATATAFPLRLRLHYKAARAGGVIFSWPHLL